MTDSHVNQKINWRSRIVKTGKIRAGELTHHPDNPKFHPDNQKLAVERSFHVLGQIARIVININNGYLVDGHERAWLALAQGDDTEIEADWVDLTDDEHELALGILDYTGQLARYDREKLDTLLQQVNTDDAALQSLLSELAEKNGIVPELTTQDAPEAQVDRADELQQKWNVQRGQVWVCGKHRVMCGDSTSAEDVARLMGGNRADMVFTDPPYLLQHYGGGFSRKEIRQEFKDNLAPLSSFNPSEFLRILSHLEWATSIIFCSKDLLPEYFNWAKAYDFNLMVWYKTNPPPFTNNTLLPDLEYMVVAHNANKIFVNGLPYHEYSRCFISDIHEGKDDVLASHPTMKPVELFKRYIGVFSNVDGVVIDFFLGSGTTLVACQQTGRIGYGMELAEKYVAVTLQRLSDMGLSPQLEA